MNTSPPLIASPIELQAMRSACKALDAARVAGHATHPHRSLVRLGFSRSTLATMALMAVVPSLALLLGRDAVVNLWHFLLTYWAKALNLGLDIQRASDSGQFNWTVHGVGSLAPSTTTTMVTAGLVVLLWIASGWMPDRQLALKYLVRMLCVIQASALLYFHWFAASFPHDLSSHVNAMLATGFLLSLALPLLLVLGWGVLDLPWTQKLVWPLGILTYFILMLPHKVLLHILVVQHFSALFMPLLYLCFSAVFDILLFVALYSWAVSRIPPGALEGEVGP